MSSVMAVEGRSVFRRSADVVSRKVGAESILVPIRQNVGNLDFVYTLSAVAADVWALLGEEHSLDEIIDAICTQYDVDRETATTDVTALVADFLDAALVSQVSSNK